MAIELDGLRVMGAIAANPDAFADIVGELPRLARTLVVKQIKAKALDLARLQVLTTALGGAAFDNVLDGLGDNEVAALIKRLDPHGPVETRTRDHLAALAAGRTAPAGKPAAKPRKAAAPKAPREPKPSAPRKSALPGAKSMNAVRQK